MAIVQSGFFTSLGQNVNIMLPAGVDWMNVYNYTQSGITGNSGIQFYWQRGMPAGGGIEVATQGASFITEQLALTSGGFTLFDNSLSPVGVAVATTASTNATQPVVSTGSTAGLATGSVVRLSNIAAQPTLCGIDFEIDTVVANTSFRIRYPLANAPGAVGGAGKYRVIANQGIWNPFRYYIASMVSAGTNTNIVTTVTSNVVIGNEVRISVPSAANGMVEIDGLQGTVTNVVGNTITVDIDSSAFTAFAWPAAASSPFTPASIYVFGENTPEALSVVPVEDILSDAIYNQAFVGMTLGAGVNGPAGQNNDLIFYVAGKSDSDNQPMLT